VVPCRGSALILVTLRGELEADVILTTTSGTITPSYGRAFGGTVDLFDTERVAATGAWRSRLPTHCQFMNCNTPEDLALAEAMAAQAPIL